MSEPTEKAFRAAVDEWPLRDCTEFALALDAFAVEAVARELETIEALHDEHDRAECQYEVNLEAAMDEARQERVRSDEYEAALVTLRASHAELLAAVEAELRDRCWRTDLAELIARAKAIQP